MAAVDDTAYSSSDGGGDRHSWENMIQLPKQSKKQPASDTDTLHVGEQYSQALARHVTSHPSYAFSSLSVFTQSSHGLWTYPPIPAMLNLLNAG